MSRRRRIGMAGAAAMAALAIAALTLDRLFPPNLERLARQSTMVVDKDGRLLQAFTVEDGIWRMRLSPDLVDARYLAMLVAYEDKRFAWHPGVDPLAAARAIIQWMRHGRVVSGASTLTMQTARLLEPRPRTIGAKLIEVLRALQLEAHYDKAEILGMYLNLAPFGGNLEGVRAACLFYFGKEPAHLTDAEAALLIAIPQRPEQLRPDRNATAAGRARDRVLARLAVTGLLTLQAAEEASDQALPDRRYSAMRHAPHLARRLHAERDEVEISSGETVRTPIDLDLQRQAEALAARYQRSLEATATLAILVVENWGRSVRAYVGSGDFFDARRLGQNDMVRAVRSPGSALKPFIYGLAFDDLLVHPETIIADKPMRFGDYAPENFDHFYRGEVTVRQALQLSLNLPAVTLLDRIGPARFATVLDEVGVPLHLPKELRAPGLPIGLGGAGVTLEQLVTLYAGLADQGRVRPLVFADDEAADRRDDDGGKPVVSPAGAWYLTEILAQSPLPPSLLAAHNRIGARAIAFKTGTSYGFRDAWAIGYDAEYTVGVWVGRPDGSFSPDRMGRDAAAPVLFELFDMLPRNPAGLAAAAAEPPPVGVIEAANAQLPLLLRRYETADDGVAGLDLSTDGPQIAFPVDGSTLDLDGGAVGMALRADGGQLPLRWLVNGLPVAALPYRRQAEWQPDGPGAVRITVIDSSGSSATAEVWIR